MTNDPFDSVTDSLISPARNAFPVAPSDDLDLTSATKALYVGSGGDVRVRLVDAASDVTFVNVPSGSVLAIRIAAIRANGTTAADLVGLA